MKTRTYDYFHFATRSEGYNRPKKKESSTSEELELQKSYKKLLFCQAKCWPIHMEVALQMPLYCLNPVCAIEKLLKFQKGFLRTE